MQEKWWLFSYGGYVTTELSLEEVKIQGNIHVGVSFTK